MQWYVVGGAVRDMLMGNIPKDVDLAFSGRAEEVHELFPHCQTVGRSVEVQIIEGKECMPLRGNSIGADLQARDLTINAFALDENGQVYAHPLAFSDLACGVLRPASDTAFFDDPTRIYRLARFSARYPHFHVHPQAIEQAAQVVAQGLHCQLPAERVGNELRKALCEKKPSRFLLTLQKSRALNYWFQEWEGAHHIPAGPLPWHNDSVLEHTGRIMDSVHGGELERWMALCHDLGKTLTERDMLPHHYGHEERGVKLAAALGTRLALPAKHIRAGQMAAREHMKGGIFEKLRLGTKRDLLHTVHSQGLDKAFWNLVDADSGYSVSTLVMPYLHCMLAVTLPEKWQNLGAESGRQLRLLQCEALSKLRTTHPSPEENKAPPLPFPDTKRP